MTQSQTIKLRAPTPDVRVWKRVAKKRGETLSRFIRIAAHAASADLVTCNDWKALLFDIRSALNLSLHVRTDEQKNARIEVALEALNRAIEVVDVR